MSLPELDPVNYLEDASLDSADLDPVDVSFIPIHIHDKPDFLYWLQNPPESTVDAFTKELTDLRIRSNSPYKNNSSSESEADKASTSSRPKRAKRLTYEDITNSLNHYYNDTSKYTNEIDILISYLRGQKHMYIQSANITNIKLYSLFITALCFTSVITIITPFIKTYWWNVILISACNAIATLLISIINYFKLESQCNTYSFLANNYEKFENSLELANNKLVFMQNETEKNQLVLDKIKELEFKISEVRDMTQLLIPPELKTLFPVITHINIFSFINKMENYKRGLIIRFKDIKNEINHLLGHINDPSTSFRELDRSQERQRILFLHETKEKVKDELLNYKDAYSQMDYLFQKEIQYAETHLHHIQCLWIYHLFFSRPKYIDPASYSNPIIANYLKLLFESD